MDLTQGRDPQGFEVRINRCVLNKFGFTLKDLYINGPETTDDHSSLDISQNNKIVTKKELSFNDKNIYDLKINYNSNIAGPKNIVVHVGLVLKEKTVQAQKEDSDYLSPKFDKYVCWWGFF